MRPRGRSKLLNLNFAKEKEKVCTSCCGTMEQFRATEGTFKTIKLKLRKRKGLYVLLWHYGDLLWHYGAISCDRGDVQNY